MNADDDRAPVIPEPYGSILARVLANDRAYFAQAPAAPHRIRPYIHGEFWPQFPPPGVQAFVRVERGEQDELRRQLLQKDRGAFIPFPAHLLIVNAADDLTGEATALPFDRSST